MVLSWKLWKQLTLLTQIAAIQELEENQNEMEQSSRRKNLDIHGLPEKSNASLTQTIMQMAGKLELSGFSSDDIAAVHRLKVKIGGTAVVLGRFTSVIWKEKWCEVREKLKQLHGGVSLPKIYFNDNFTKANRDLFWKVRRFSVLKHYFSNRFQVVAIDDKGVFCSK